MGVWGSGLLQSDHDYDIADLLEDMLGFSVLHLGDEERVEVLKKLDDGLLSQTFDKMLSPEFQFNDSWYARERGCIILAMLSMEVGAKIESRHIEGLRDLRKSLPNMYQQLQISTALDEYKNNGTVWILGSKGLMDTASSTPGETEYDNGDEFWFSGLGHSADENPYPHTWSKRCLFCSGGGDEDGRHLLRCSRCNMARYCGEECQKNDLRDHRRVCEPHALRSVRVPDISAPQTEESSESDGPEVATAKDNTKTETNGNTTA